MLDSADHEQSGGDHSGDDSHQGSTGGDNSGLDSGKDRSPFN
jgi:hypothetical protein